MRMIPIQPALKTANSQIRGQVHPSKNATTPTAHIAAQLPEGVNGEPDGGISGSNLQEPAAYVNENEQAVQNLLDEF